jgi:hypothetical protein
MLLASDHHRNFTEGLAEATRFFMGVADVQKTAECIGDALDDMGISYVVAGGIAVGVHGYQRVTKDVDILISAENLWHFKERWVGRGWVDRFPGSKSMRDAGTGVNVDILLVGDYPGDGKPKPVCFPSPERVEMIDSGLPVRIMDLQTLIELKLASGMSAPDRLKDLDDVIQLVRANDLPKAFALDLNPWVREKYTYMWLAAQAPTEMHSSAWARIQKTRRR